ncbi:MAG: hypothetical protein M1822_006086 [Bathelium mastoideum]|nr:MAG: hypothetical protein M1822_006086 [Bathelium mastoideum]
MADNDNDNGRLPEPKDLTHHLSQVTRNRVASSMKQFYQYFMLPGIGQFAGGLPNAYYFPFDTLEAKSALPNRWKPTPNKPVDPPYEQLASTSLASDSTTEKPEPTSSNVVVPHFSSEVDPLRKIDLDTALQYGTAQGYPPMYYFVRQFTRNHMHPNHRYQGGPEIILTCGSTDGFSKAFTALSNEWSEERDLIKDREGLLCEEFAYMNAIQAAKPRGLNIVPVAIDDEGMKADGKGGLEDVLANWDYSKGRRPHLLYTVTIGQNPTSGVLSAQRRQEIYALCSKYDIVIIEDDPYWYLQYPTANAKKRNFPESSTSSSTEPNGKSSGYAFLDSLVPSYISFDTDGRVIRLDTFSKTIAPGCRLGWITAQPALVERILRITETSTQQPSGFVQATIAELVLGGGSKAGNGTGGARDGSGWGFDGWVRWIEGLRGNYERRMNTFCAILDDGQWAVKTGRRRSLGREEGEDGEWSVVEKTRLYSFEWPLGGMFVWLGLNLEAHPLWRKVPPARLARAQWVFWTTEPYRVLVTPGSLFAPSEEIREKKSWRFFRMCFAAINEDQLAPTTQRFVDGVQKFFTFKDVAKIDEILKDDDPGFGVQQVMQLEVGDHRTTAIMGGPC